MNKIICVGNSMTTSSSTLDMAHRLGFSTLWWHEVYVKRWLAGEADYCVAAAAPYQFLMNWPWRCIYKQLDAAYPDSKFLLTVRDEEAWATDFIRNVAYYRPADWVAEARLKAYGFDPEAFLDDKDYLIERVYRAQNADVRNHFKDRPDDMLEIDLSRTRDWDALCAFLEIPVPLAAFPPLEPQAGAPVVLGYGAIGGYR